MSLCFSDRSSQCASEASYQTSDSEENTGEDEEDYGNFKRISEQALIQNQGLIIQIRPKVLTGKFQSRTIQTWKIWNPSLQCQECRSNIALFSKTITRLRRNSFLTNISDNFSSVSLNKYLISLD